MGAKDIKEYQREYRKENAAKYAEYSRNYRRGNGIGPKPKFPDAKPGFFVCRKCLVEQPIGDFPKDKNVKRGHGSHCLACQRVRQAVIREKRGERKRKALSVDVPDGFYFCPKCETIKPKADCYKVYCKTCQIEIAIAWKAQNKDKAREHARISKRKRELKLKVINGKHKPSEWEALKRKYDNKCLCCGASEPEIKLTRDHIIPLSKGGDNSIDNIQPLCMKCNSKKKTAQIDFRKHEG